MVQDLQFCANWVQHQLLRLEEDLSADEAKGNCKREGKRVRVSCIPKFIVVADSEASDAESPRFEDVAGVEIPQDVLDGVGTTPMEEVEMEKEEEEDPDIHFKRKLKRKGEPRRKRVVKKTRHHTPVVAESKSVAIVSPPAPLVIKLSVQKKAIEKAAPGLGKINLHLQDFFYSPFLCS